jgi:hypothetical protein
MPPCCLTGSVLTWLLLRLLLLLQGMGMSPEMMNMMSQMDFSQEKVQQQFSELGLKPEDVIQKVRCICGAAACSICTEQQLACLLACFRVCWQRPQTLLVGLCLAEAVPG